MATLLGDRASHRVLIGFRLPASLDANLGLREALRIREMHGNGSVACTDRQPISGHS